MNVIFGVNGETIFSYNQEDVRDLIDSCMALLADFMEGRANRNSIDCQREYNDIKQFYDALDCEGLF